MARIPGRTGRLYVNLASGGTAEPVMFLTKWDIGFETDKFEVTAQGDSNKTYLSGLPAANGTYSGWYDDATSQLYAAAVDGVARKFYAYPSTANTGQYWFGTALFDFKFESPVDNVTAVSGSFAAAGPVAKVG